MGIQQLRNERGLTLSELSRATGITIANLHRIETGKADPHLSSVEAILEALGAELSIITKQ